MKYSRSTIILLSNLGWKNFEDPNSSNLDQWILQRKIGGI